jgi:hypothetical protein
MPDTRTYRGGCHCGAVRYEATTDLAMVVACNCSICLRRGALWSFVKALQFKLHQGEAELTDYQFASKKLHHLFCSHCGVGSFSRGKGPDGADTVALNVRCLDNVDVSSLTLTPYDGKNA